MKNLLSILAPATTKTLQRTAILALSLFALAACSDPQAAQQKTMPVAQLQQAAQVEQDVQKNSVALTKPVAVIYKSASCGCCGKWVSHLEDNGFSTQEENTQDLNAIKQRFNIAPQYQSCHTAHIGDYVFEGHIPAALVERFLAEKPANAIGLAVPGMPAGSPGMEMGDRSDDYQVLMLMRDGSSHVYAQVNGTQASVIAADEHAHSH